VQQKINNDVNIYINKEINTKDTYLENKFPKNPHNYIKKKSWKKKPKSQIPRLEGGEGEVAKGAFMEDLL
jgi:hypothetical protein